MSREPKESKGYLKEETVLSVQHNYEESRYRSVLKTLSWRMVATTTTFLLVFIFTGKPLLSAGVGATEVVTKLVFYYLHERFWCAVPLLRRRKTTRKSLLTGGLQIRH